MTTYRDWSLTADDVYPRQSLSGFSSSPDGKWLCFLFRRDWKRRLDKIGNHKVIRATPIADVCLMPSGGGYPQPLTTTGDITALAGWHPTDGSLLLEREDCLQSVSLSGEVVTLYEGEIYHPPLKESDSYLGRPIWSPDGENVLFAVRVGHTTHLVRVSRHGQLREKVLSIEGSILSWQWSPSGNRILLVTRNPDGLTGAIQCLDIQAGHLVTLSNESDMEYQKPVAVWLRAGEQVLFRSNRSGWSKLWIASMDSFVPQPFTYGPWDDEGFRISLDGQRVVYASRADQVTFTTDLWIASLADGTSERLTNHVGTNQPIAWINNDVVLYWHNSPIDSGDAWLISVADSIPTRVTWSSSIALERKLRAPQESLVPHLDEGHIIPSLVYLPAWYETGEKYPPIVWIHGGPTSASLFEYNPFLNWLANNGFVVIVPNYRGSIGFGVEFMQAVSGEGLGKNDLADILATGHNIRQLPFVDATRGIGVGGRSWGGYLTLMAITQSPDTFSCAVAGSAITNWFVQQAQTEVRYYDRWLLGDWVYNLPDLARSRSPLTFVDRLKVPLLLYHGEEDVDVPFAQITQFYERARRIQPDIVYVTYPGEGHSNLEPAHQKDVLHRMSSFFRFHLQAWNYHDNPSGGQTQY